MNENLERPFFDPSVQTLPIERLAEVRQRSVATLLEALRDRSGTYYSADRLGGTELASHPPLSGEELSKEVADHPPFGRLQLIAGQPLRAGLTTTAVPWPTPIVWTESDLRLDAKLGARCFWRAGLRPRGRSSDCLDGGLVTPGTLAITDALDTLDALALPVGPIKDEAALKRAQEVWGIVKPQVLICGADSFRFLHSRSRRPAPVLVTLLTPHDAAPLGAARQADTYRIFSLPQAGTFIAGECSAHNGYHIAEDAFLAEIVHAHSKPVPDGTIGRLLLTTLKRSFTLVRFDTGLDASIDRRICSCGETHARLRFAG